MRYDVIVVGAGPAGSTAARECAGRGLSVLMLDKAEFPRDKPCGGGVSPAAAELLPFDLTPVVERSVAGVHFSHGPFLHYTRNDDTTIWHMTQRVHLDAFLVERAVEAGVVLKERTPLQELDRHPAHVVVRSDKETFEGRTLVAADGANGITVKLAGIETGVVNRLAIEGNVTCTDGFPEKWENRIGIVLGSHPGGYGWLFPKGDHLNIGLGGYRRLAPTYRQKLNGLTRFYGYDPAGLWGIRGHDIPIRSRPSPLADGNVLLVGDAGGLVETFSAEGIYGAFWSGRSAARHLEEYLDGKTEDLGGYHRDVVDGLFPYLNVSYDTPVEE